MQKLLLANRASSPLAQSSIHVKYPTQERLTIMQGSRKLCKVVLTSLLVFGFGQKCFADSVLYSNLGNGSDVYSSSSIGALGISFSFVPTSTAYFTELDIALDAGYFTGDGVVDLGSDSATVELMSDSAGSPGSALESWNVSGLPSFIGACCSLISLPGDGTILLDSGTTYWVAAFAGDDEIWWNENATGAIQGLSSWTAGYGWTNYPLPYIGGALEVQGVSATPEPGTLTLLGSGSLGLAGLMRRRLRRSAI
jgi:hypothetical protein